MVLALLATLLTPTASSADYPFDLEQPFDDGAGGYNPQPDSGGSGGSNAGSSASPFDRVVTMGDSYAAGVGIHRNDTDYADHGPTTHFTSDATRLGASTCQRDARNNHGGQLARKYRAEHQMVACRGAETEHIPNQLKLVDIPGTGDRTLIVLTIGGNDIRTDWTAKDNDGNPKNNWPDTLRKCIFERNCHRNSDHTINNFSAIEGWLVEIYTDIMTKYPDATLRIMGYPELMQPGLGPCLSVTGVNGAEARWFDRMALKLDQTVRDAVRQAGYDLGYPDMKYVHIANEFDKHGACAAPWNRYINDGVWGRTLERVELADGRVIRKEQTRNVTKNSFHPTQKGYDAFYRSVLKTL